MEDNCFTMLCWFLPCINMNQPQIYICPLPPERPSRLPPQSHRSRLSQVWVSCVLQQIPLAIYLHMVMHMFPCCSLNSSYPLLPPLCPRLFSVCISCYPANGFINILETEWWRIKLESWGRILKGGKWLHFGFKLDLVDPAMKGFPTMREFFKVLQKEQSCDHRIGGLCSILESPASQSRTHSQYHRHHWEFIKMQPPHPHPRPIESESQF